MKLNKEMLSIMDQDCDQENSCSELGMWRAVIAQALMDASSNSRKSRAKLLKVTALRWLKGDSKDFQDVCILAEMDESYVRAASKRALKRGCKWRNDNRYPGAIDN